MTKAQDSLTGMGGIAGMVGAGINGLGRGLGGGTASEGGGREGRKVMTQSPRG